MASRATYGHVDHEGYLQAGLCLGYGEGTGEAIERYRSRGTIDSAELRAGDVERAVLEWRSLLRHVVHASEANAPRWAEFQVAAAACLAEQERRNSAPALVELPAALQRRAEARPMPRF